MECFFGEACHCPKRGVGCLHEKVCGDWLERKVLPALLGLLGGEMKATVPYFDANNTSLLLRISLHCAASRECCFPYTPSCMCGDDWRVVTCVYRGLHCCLLSNWAFSGMFRGMQCFSFPVIAAHVRDACMDTTSRKLTVVRRSWCTVRVEPDNAPKRYRLRCGASLTHHTA